MITFRDEIVSNCGGSSRRSLLKLGALAGLGASLPMALAARGRAADPKTRDAKAGAGNAGKDVNCILVWTLGGTSHHDTLDPKPDASMSVRGEFSVIDTAVPGVKFTEVCPRLAQELDRFAVLRSFNPRNGAHGSADAYNMSGHPYTPTMAFPCIGSVISHQKGFKSVLPPFVQLGSYVDRTYGGGTAAFLGLEHNPFDVFADPNDEKFSVKDITPPQAMKLQRVERRRTMLAKMDRLQRAVERQPAAYDALDEHYKTALNMITAPATKRAFDLGAEDPRLRDRYGRNRFGQSLLLARRLVQSGVRFVTVSDPAWDTHADNFKQLKTRLMPSVDQGLPELLADLEQQGMLDDTLVVWLTDFGRTPQINAASGRDHWATSGFVVMAGAGIPRGAVLGATDPEGGAPVSHQYFPEDVVSTIYHKLGLPLDLILHTPDGRPIRTVEGRVIKEWVSDAV
jgi:hypothetical protein